MAVDLDNMPVECGPFISNGFGRHDMSGRAGLLNAVVIDNHFQVIQSELGPKKQALPDNTGVQLPVAQDNVDMAMRSNHASGQGHTGSDSYAVTKRPGGYFDTRRFCRLRMSLKARIQCAKGRQFLYWKLPAVGQSRVQHGAGMTF